MKRAVAYQPDWLSFVTWNCFSVRQANSYITLFELIQEDNILSLNQAQAWQRYVKHMDDLAYLRKHAKLGYLPNRNLWIDQPENVKNWSHLQPYLMCRNWFESVKWGGSPCKWNIRTCPFLTILKLTSLNLFFLYAPYRPDGSTNLRAHWLKRRSLSWWCTV